MGWEYEVERAIRDMLCACEIPVDSVSVSVLSDEDGSIEFLAESYHDFNFAGTDYTLITEIAGEYTEFGEVFLDLQNVRLKRR